MKEELPEDQNAFFCLQSSNVEHQSIPSEFNEQYIMEMSSIKEQVQQKSFKFKQCGILYNPSQHKQFTFKVINRIGDTQGVACLEVMLGGFTIELKIYCSIKKSILFKIQPLREGSFGFIYNLDLFGRQVILKSTKLSLQMSPKKKRTTFHKVLKEFCISKICQVLKCGPSLPQIFGFDILLFGNSIEFAIEPCELIQAYEENNYRELLETLAILHKHYIIHMDITPQNIMFSKSQGKMVFIDFGLSKIIGEDCGFKTYTTFNGTPRYVSKEMLNLFSVDVTYGFIDLYYNDIHCLKKTITKMKELCKQKKPFVSPILNLKSNSNKFILELKGIEEICPEPIYQFILFVHECFFNEINAAQIFFKFKETFLKNFKKQLISFLMEVSSNVIKLILDQPEGFSSEEIEDLRKMLLRNSNLLHFSSEEINNQNFTDLYFQNQTQFSDVYPSQKQSVLKHLADDQYFNQQDDKTQYYGLLLTFLRFDRKNIDFGSKQKLANKFVAMIAKEDLIDPHCELSSCRIVFKYLLKFCFSTPENEWKKDHIFIIILQAIMTDTNIIEELEVIEGKILEMESFQNLFQKFAEFFFLDKFMEKKCLFEDHALGLKTTKKIKEIFLIVGSTLNQKKSVFDPLDLKMISLMQQISETTINPKILSYDYLTVLSDVKNSFFRETLELMYWIQSGWCLTIFKEEYSFHPEKVQLRSWHSSEKKSLARWDIVYPIELNAIYIQFQLISDLEIMAFFNQIKEIFNQVSIFNQFSFKYFLIDDDTPSATLKTYMQEIIKICFEDEKFQFFLRGIPSIITIISKTYSKSKKINDEYYQVCYQFQKAFYNYLQKNIQMFIKEDNSKITNFQQLLASDSQLKIPSENILAYLVSLIFQFQQMDQQKNIYLKNLTKLLNRIRFTALNNFAIGEGNIFLYYSFLASNKIRSDSSLVLHELMLKTSRYLNLIQNCLSEGFNFQIFGIPLTMLFYIYTKIGYETQSIDLKMVLERIQSIMVWLNKKVMLNSLELTVYFNLFGTYSHHFLNTLFILSDSQQIDVIYELLFKVTIALSQPSLKGIQNQFMECLIMFYHKRSFIFNLTRIKQCFGETISWENRLAIIFYAFVTPDQNQISVTKSLLILIAKNVEMLSIKIKNIVLTIYYFVILITVGLGIIKKQRKRKFVIFRGWTLYFPQIQPVQQFFKVMKKNAKRRVKNSNSVFMKAFVGKIEKIKKNIRLKSSTEIK